MLCAKNSERKFAPPLRPMTDAFIVFSVFEIRSIEPRRPRFLTGFFRSFLVQMHEKGGNFCIFLLKIAEKEGKPTCSSSPAAGPAADPCPGLTRCG